MAAHPEPPHRAPTFDEFLAKLQENDPSIKTVSFLKPSFFSDEKIGRVADIIATNNHVKRLIIGKPRTARGEPVTVIGLGYIAKIISTSPSLEYVQIEDLRIDSDSATILADALANNPRIKTLSLENNELTTLGIRFITRILIPPSVSNITQFRIIENSLNLDAIGYIGEVIKNSPSVDILVLRKDDIDDSGVEILSEAIKFRTAKQKNGFVKELTILDLSENKIELRGWRHLASALKGSSVKKLFLSESKIGDDDLAILAPGLGDIESLIIYKNDITARGLDELSYWNDYSKLTLLNIGNNPLGNDGLQKLMLYLKDNSVLTWLGIRDIGTTSESLIRLAEDLKTSDLSALRAVCSEFARLSPTSYSGVKRELSRRKHNRIQRKRSMFYGLMKSMGDL